MKKLFLYVFLGLLWCNVGFAQSDLLLNLLYFSTTNEKKVQRLSDNYICKDEKFQLDDDWSDSKIEEKFGFLEFNKELFYSKYALKLKKYLSAISIVKTTKKDNLFDVFEWFTHETNDGLFLVEHKLEETVHFNLYEYKRNYYILKEHQKRDLHILLRRVLDLDKAINKEVSIRNAIVEYSEKSEAIFKSFENNPSKTKLHACGNRLIIKRE